MFENVGGGEILLILIVVLIFFGPKKIPELAHSLGKGLRKFNEAKDGIETQMKTIMKEPMDALNEAKAGFEAKLLDASQPLRETFFTAQSTNGSSAATPAPAPQLAAPVQPSPAAEVVAPVATVAPVVEPAKAEAPIALIPAKEA